MKQAALLLAAGVADPVQRLNLLRNALQQTHPALAAQHADWRQGVLARLEAAEQKTLIADVQPFLERPQDAQWLQKEHLRNVLAAKS